MLVGIIATYILATPVEAVSVEDTPAHIPGKATVKKVAKLPRESKPTLAKTFRQSPKPVASSGGDIELIVRQAARKYGIDEEHFVKIAMCESTMDPLARNPNPVIDRFGANHGHAEGLFQFIPATWKRMSTQAGFAGRVVTDVYANANTAAWAFQTGHQDEWECH